MECLSNGRRSCCSVERRRDEYCRIGRQTTRLLGIRGCNACRLHKNISLSHTSLTSLSAPPSSPSPSLSLSYIYIHWGDGSEREHYIGKKHKRIEYIWKTYHANLAADKHTLTTTHTHKNENTNSQPVTLKIERKSSRKSQTVCIAKKDAAMSSASGGGATQNDSGWLGWGGGGAAEVSAEASAKAKAQVNPCGCVFVMSV